MTACQIRWLETSNRSYCATHQRDEMECVKAELVETKLQVVALKNFYDWYVEAGSWSIISPDPKDGCRWTLTFDEGREGERLSDAVDAVLKRSPKLRRGCDCGASLPFPAHQPGCPLHAEYRRG